MDVADDCDGREDVHHVGFGHELLFKLVAEGFDNRFREEGFGVQARDAFVQVEVGCAGG